MSVRIALAMAAVGLLAMGVYLFVEVRSPPADAAKAAPPRSDVAHAAEPLEHSTSASSERGEASVPVVAPSAASGPHHSDSASAGDPPESAVDEHAKPKLDAIMDQANKAYDRQDFDEARTFAGKVLAAQPNNVRMLRIMVSSSCIDGDSITAQKYYPLLPKFDRDQMKTRCDRYGVTFTDSP
jgi:hypothetical protein